MNINITVLPYHKIPTTNSIYLGSYKHNWKALLNIHNELKNTRNKHEFADVYSA